MLTLLQPEPPTLAKVGYPLCFDNDPFCLSSNPFVLITIWTAYVRIPHSSFALSLSFTRAPRKLPLFNRLPTLSPKCRGVHPGLASGQPGCPQDHSQSGTPTKTHVPSFGAFFTLLPCTATHLPSFQSFPHSLPKHWGCTSERISTSLGKASLPLRSLLTTEDCLLTTSSSRPLHPPPHGGTIWSVIGLSGSSVIRETFPPVPVSKIQERTTGSTARLIQQLARDRRPGPLAIGSRNPVPPFTEKGRPGKASSVRLGSIVGP